MSDQDKHKIQELLSMVIEAIDVIQSRSIRIKSGNDFLLSPDNMFILDGVCMKLIFIGESIKTIDKISKGEFLSLYPSIPWSSIMKQRDLIAHHYLRIDADSIYATINQDLPILLDVLQDMIKKLE